MRALELLQDNPELLGRYRERFRWLLVDEFQDTNGIQYNWLKLLCGTSGLPFAVGDDDQSIYRWRGAQVENIRHYSRDFRDVRIVRLERNYRSTATILEAANAVIANNASRFSKKLWTRGEKGGPVRLFAAYNEWDEANQVVSRAREHGAGVAARPGGAVPLQRPVAGLRGSAGERGHSLPRIRRPAVLRAGRDQGRPGLPAPGSQPRRTTRRSSGW